ncbi:unnamed protein product [Thelazia callipaeda]|uniref:Adenosine 3'-phospho 5'-phosphosulfate transporter 1 n=1 Tax=Thelazia callipaeda TaxID=103827 RepID=A0A0N5CN51_THECL|nr:unnamed protein product [Thelazia callipaeda]
MLLAVFSSDFWLVRFFFILSGYATVSVPVILLVYYVRRKTASKEYACCNFVDGSFKQLTFLDSFLLKFAVGRPDYELMIFDTVKLNTTVPQKTSLMSNCSHLLLCFSGLQITLVSMGYIQEKIMTKGYLSTVDHQLWKFENTQFLVFVNRVFAIFFCVFYLSVNWKREPVHAPPLYKHSFASLSNTLSSWCQYEALKYVSFPAQIVCKASKVLPTMLMGFIVRGERYGRTECLCAFTLAFGASLFFLSNNSAAFGSNGNLLKTFYGRVTTISGILLMSGYLLFDAFTLNWQKKLFDVRPRVSRYQMMFGVNIFSMFLCFVTLIEEGAFTAPFRFLATHEGFARDVFLLSLSGALGQVVIYSTIERFGPSVFAIMMTLRQITSILLSTIAYGHPMSAWSILGLSVTFVAIFGSIYNRYLHTLRTNR